jgi:16S rRNA (cytosine967-C5)-methyltransferase
LESIPVQLPSELLNADGTMQLWPHRHGTDAMYLALFRKRKG